MTDVKVSIEADEWYPVYGVLEVAADASEWTHEGAYTLTAKEIKAGRKAEAAFADWQNRLHRLVDACRVREEATLRKQEYEANQAAARAKQAAKAERRRLVREQRWSR